MALNKELWSSIVTKELLASNTFLDAIKNYGSYVDNKYVHIPVQQADFSTVLVNPTSFPISTVNTRVDTDNQVLMDLFACQPIALDSPIEFYELNYDKRADVMQQAINLLKQTIADKALIDLGTWSGVTITTCTGTGKTSSNAYQSGNRASISASDILKIKYQFDSQDVPAEDRVLLLPAEMYNDLLKLPDFKASYLLTTDVNKFNIPGTVGKIYDFTVVMRSRVLLTNSGATIVNTTTNKFASLTAGTGQTAANAAGIAFSLQTVGKAAGEIKLYERVEDPLYLTTIINMSVRGKAFSMFTAAKGLAVISEI